MVAGVYFGLDPSPKYGGSSDDDRFHYRFFPGVPAPVLRAPRLIYSLFDWGSATYFYDAMVYPFQVIVGRL